MSNLLDKLFGDTKVLLFVLAVLLLLLAIMGNVPINFSTGAAIELDLIQRLLIAGLAVVTVIISLLPSAPTRGAKRRAPTDSEYKERFQASQAEDRQITPEGKILGERDFPNQARVVVINDNIVNASTDILVSSDDNYLQAMGGVAKAILGKAGQQVNLELEHYRRHKIRQGDVAITTGGTTKARAIIHPAVIDLDRNKYPDQDLVRKIVRRALRCAAALGAESIVFPVLGGGTASKNLTPWDSISAIIQESVSHFEGKDLCAEGNLNYIGVFVFDAKDITGDVQTLLYPEAG